MSKITAWPAIISTPEFWAIHYFSHLDREDDEDEARLVEDIFGCNFNAIQALYDQLMGFDEDPAGMVAGVDWNVLTIPFPAGYEWRIEFNTVPGMYHTLVHANFAEPLKLGRDDPHCLLPILRWPEVAPLAACARRHGQVAFDPRALYLLFYPLMTLTEADDLDAARRELTRAWAEFGLLAPDQVTQLVARVTWVDADLHWWRDETRGWITDAYYSYRNPDNRWTPEDFTRWNAFFAEVMHRALQ